MKRLILLLCLAAAACTGSRYGAGIPATYDRLLDSAFSRAGDRACDLRRLLAETPASRREGMAYLLAHMPQGDLDTLDLEILRENVEYAYLARERFPWAGTLPDSVFLNEVLPYAVADEVREAWRKGFYTLFAPVAAECTDIRAAIDSVNRRIPRIVDVEYNTLREKTNQNPSESMRQHMASCTGLSILLVDALRAVGIPARFAGTAAWHDDRGNHSWTEVWIDGEWHFTEYYFVGIDKPWFLADAGQATPGDRAHAIYAVSYRPTGEWFPMVWNEDSRDVHAVEVTRSYVERYAQQAEQRMKAGTHTRVRFVMWHDRNRCGQSGDRVAANVDVFRGTEQTGGGRTAGPRQVMNDVLEFLLEKGGCYTFRYENARGEQTEITALVGDEPMTVAGYME